MPLDDYLNQMLLDRIYGDQVTLDAVASLYNTHICITSSFGQQVAVDIYLENLQWTLILAHYIERQDDHVIYLQKDQSIENSEVD